MAADTHARMIEAAIESLRRRGVAGMSFTDVLNASGAARGAIYHHFPGGKAQLVAAAAERNGRDVRARFASLPAASPQHVVAAFLAAVRPVVEASTAGAGCAVAAVAIGSDGSNDGSNDSGASQLAAAHAFTSWIEALASRLAAAGLAAGEATDLAATLITLLEGAHILCRAVGTLEPFDQAARAATGLIRCRYPLAAAKPLSARPRSAST